MCVFAAQQLRRHGNNSAESNLSLASGERTTRWLLLFVCAVVGYYYKLRRLLPPSYAQIQTL
jgi:hypothetical protein